VFATLLGALPRPTGDGISSDDVDRLIEAAVRAQEDAGLEPITDGRLRGEAFARLPTPSDAVRAWEATQAMSERAVKQALPGPFSYGDGASDVESLAEVARALAEAGCPLIEIEETAADRLSDPAERARFGELHRRVLGAVPGTHLSLSIVGPAPDESAWQTVLGLPYASLAVDLIAGPESWNLVTRWPGERGVIAGVESARKVDEPKELLLWGAQYAASTQARGMDRVGLGSSGSWADLTWAVAVRKLRVLGDSARLAMMPPGRDLAHSLDPKAITSRHAALGHDV